jgi:hypothetical protein
VSSTTDVTTPEQWEQLNRRQLICTLGATIMSARRMIKIRRELNRPIDDLEALLVIAHRVLDELDA